MSQEFQNIDSTFLNEVKKNSGLTIAMGIIVLLMGMFAMGSPFIAGVSLAIAVGFMLIIGIISVVLGAMIWRQFPVSGVWTVGTLVGIKLFFSGWTLLIFGFTARAAAKEAGAA